MNEVEHLLAIRNKLGEGPLWHAAEGRLYWVDIEGHCFYRMDLTSGEAPQQFKVGLPLGALAFRANGGLLLATQKGFAFWDATAQVLDFIVDPEADKSMSRFNDGALDRQGRFWAGTMGDGDNNALYRLDPDGSLHIMEKGVGVSNGIGWSPDNQTMYYADSPRQTIYAYDYDAATGVISGRRDFIHDPDEPGYPDGLTVDRDGFIWCARWGGWSLLRYDPRGQLERKIPLPVQFPTSCIFGGPQLNELYITSAWTALSAARRAEQPLAGDLFRLQTMVKGIPEPEFAG